MPSCVTETLNMNMSLIFCYIFSCCNQLVEYHASSWVTYKIVIVFLFQLRACSRGPKIISYAINLVVWELHNNFKYRGRI